jgi:hypothetical protein
MHGHMNVKFVTMHGHMNVTKKLFLIASLFSLKTSVGSKELLKAFMLNYNYKMIGLRYKLIRWKAGSGHGLL